jgi:hypothetical protein
LVGNPQPQSALLATDMVGSKGSGMLALIGRDIRLPGTRRLFIDLLFDYVRRAMPLPAPGSHADDEV